MTPRNDGRQHGPNCWLDWQHHQCTLEEISRLTASLAAAQADAARWQGKYAELRAIVLLVEDFADNRDATTALALIDAFNAFRALVEGGTPRTWLVGAPGGAGAGAGAIDEWEPTRVDQDAEGAPWV